MGSKKQKKEVEETPIHKEQVPIDRNWAKPCRDCRKRDSCFITRPYEERCASLEVGTPWSISYENSLPSLQDE